ncbi:Ribosomal RNA adenine dimethylase domain-containing protein 1 [Cichlidogyrus casuarinus]|uniref:Ribosomal RNA adenine dimethylase domain-containing protein 1 n=1 Tax=Cichlidogyrus casuarinus TaxID=1844966 RepID=A0ABD2PT63_9PLAT
MNLQIGIDCDKTVISNEVRSHLTPKKLHEITQFSRIVEQVSNLDSIDAIVDIGAGLGHLDRILSYKLCIPTYCLEVDENLSKRGQKFDEKSLKIIQKRDNQNVPSPVHFSHKFGTGDNSLIDHLVQNLSLNDAANLLLTGLHACGDLSTATIDLFLENLNFKWLILVGCCYMKRLSYACKEAACHNIYPYIDRLRSDFDGVHLRMQAFRAKLEQLLSQNPDIAAKPSRSRRFNARPCADFVSYVKLYLEKNACANAQDLLKLAEEDQQQQAPDFWLPLIKFHVIRLMLSSVAESLILADRLCLLQESGHSACLINLFDYSISPRNIALFAMKN